MPFELERRFLELRLAAVVLCGKRVEDLGRVRPIHQVLDIRDEVVVEARGRPSGIEGQPSPLEKRLEVWLNVEGPGR